MNLQNLTQKIRNDYSNIHSVIVASSKEILYEGYFSGEDGRYGYTDFDKNTLHDLRSATKSINSLLVGIAIEKGCIKSTNDKVLKYFEEKYFLSEYKNELTIKHLLTMSSGLEWNQSGTRSKSEVDAETEMEKSFNPLEYVLSKDIIYELGTKFNYCSGDSILLGKIVEIAFGDNLNNVAKKYLFEQLDITNYDWWEPRAGVYWTHAGLRMLPIDMCKIGQMLLQKGRYNNIQIVSEDWIKKSTRKNNTNIDYGYQWWLKSFLIKGKRINSFFAAGNGGQRIYILPDIDLVTIFTAGNYHSKFQNQSDEILEKEILSLI